MRDDMTCWESFVENLNLMVGAGELCICIGFCVEEVGHKEIDCISQLFTYAKDIGIIARSEAEWDQGTKAIVCAACTDARWGMVHMVMVSDDLHFPLGRWNVYSDCWFEGRY
jgi:hypothetical protein